MDCKDSIYTMDEVGSEDSSELDNAITIVPDRELRLDIALSEYDAITRSQASELIENGAVSVNGRIITKKSIKVKQGDCISLILPEPVDCAAVAQDIPIDVVYEDDDLLVVNKAKGMVVHPAPGNPDGTLVNALLHHCSGSLSAINGVIRPGIVHRIDKDTSGLLVVAKNDKAHVGLAEQIKEHSFTRIYNALLYGTLRDSSGTVDAPIGRNTSDRKKMAVTHSNSKNAVTHFRVLESFDKFSFCEMKLETGRTHQIRVHMAHIGHPVVGDLLYAPKEGKNQFGIVGQALHAKTLGFIHPISGRYLEFSSELPMYFSEALDKLRRMQQ